MEFLTEAFIYQIELNGIPLYIGSTGCVKDREYAHNKHIETHDSFMYRELRKLGIRNVQLKVIKKFKNYFYKGKDGTIYEYRYYVENKYIEYCINKGLVLLNTYFPCCHDSQLNYVPKYKRLISYPIDNKAVFKPEPNIDLFGKFTTSFKYD